MKVHKIFRWLPAILLMFIIFIFSSIPSTTMPSFGLLDLLVKKGGHMVGYGLLAIAFLFAIGNNDIKYQRIAILLTILYSLTDEWHQTYVPGRFGSLWDIGIDGVGSFLAIWLNNKIDLFGKFKL